MFKDGSGRLLYVGKAKNVRYRVKSYFQPPTRLGPKTAALVARIGSVDHIQVTSELEALLLESRLIKKFYPPYNIASRDDKTPYYIHITLEEYPKPIINHQPEGAIAGPFLNRLVPSRILRQLRRVAPFCLASRPVKRPCLYSHLGLCHPCPATHRRGEYLKNISRLRSLLNGNFSRVAASLKKKMYISAKKLQYEGAGQIKKYLESLEWLLLTPIRPDEYITNPNLASDLGQDALDSLCTALNLPSLARIEFFDNAHLSGTSSTSAMTVAIQGQVTPGSYRHFTLSKTSGSDDVNMMREVLVRRLKRADWPQPDLIVLDGGKPQLSVIGSLLSIPCPVIALSKRDETIHFSNGGELKLSRDHPGLRLLMRLRDEAHRFSRRLHHKHRSNFLRQPKLSKY